MKSLTRAQARKKAEELRQSIREHDHAYYVLSNPVITDQEYDALMKELQRLEGLFPDLVVPDSPTQRVGGEAPESFKTVTHAIKMLSLDNTYSTEELRGWEKKIQKISQDRGFSYCVELKIDGVSASLSFENGFFRLGSTRGDGQRGEDITRNIKTIQGFPLKLLDDFPQRLEVRGEIYLDKKEFNALNTQKKERGEEPFANPRNAASGSLKLLDPKLVSQRHLKYFVHSFGSIAGKDIPTQHRFLERARSWGLAVSEHYRVCRSMEEVLEFCVHWQKNRASLPYEVDGMVIKVDDLSVQKRLGTTLKSPRWAVAYKFPGEQAITRLKEVLIQVGRTGVLTPVAVLEPVECGGVTISRATLHNFDEIKRLQLKENDHVLVERAGEVIPKIVKVMQDRRQGDERPVSMPHRCPACGGNIVRDEEEVAVRCINPDCPAQLARSLLHFASRQAMDIEGFGDAVVEALVQNNMVKSLLDIYRLREQDFMRLPLFAEKKAEKLTQAIADSKVQPLHRFIFGLGIRHIGQKAALSLAQGLMSIDRFLEVSKDDLLKVPDIGEVAAQSVIEFFRQRHVRGLMDGFKRLGLKLREQATVVSSGPLSGKKVVFTGTLSSFTRDQAQETARRLGAEVMDQVSSRTDVVVAGANPGSKIEAARRRGVMVIDENEFIRMSK